MEGTPLHRGDVSVVLAVVAPRCHCCSRPATRYQGSPFNGAPAKQYACDLAEHATIAGKWTDLPAAEAIRRLMEYAQ